MPAAAAYAESLAAAIVASLRADPPPGSPARVVIRWFEGPGYLTVHALGTDEEADVPAADAWLALEWANAAREITRVDAIFADPTLSSAAAALAAELEDGSWSWDAQPEPLVQAAARVRQLLADLDVEIPDHFAVGVSHFEGWGSEDSVPRANPETVLAHLRKRGIEPGGRRRRLSLGGLGKRSRRSAR